MTEHEVAARRDLDSIRSMIMVMGETGTGKSRFINCLKGASVVKESSTVHSVTKDCHMVPMSVADDLKVAIVDTPGFNDSSGSDIPGLDAIAEFVTIQRELGLALKGIIYLHDISHERMYASSQKHFRLFREMCGDEALANVAILTTFWSKVDRIKGLDRQLELLRDFWQDILQHGGLVIDFNDTKASAEAVIGQLLSKPGDIVLQIQQQLEEQGPALINTTAGQTAKQDEELLMKDATSQNVAQTHQENIDSLNTSIIEKVRQRIEAKKAEHAERMQREAKAAEEESDSGEGVEDVASKSAKRDRMLGPMQLFVGVANIVVSTMVTLFAS